MIIFVSEAESATLQWGEVQREGDHGLRYKAIVPFFANRLGPENLLGQGQIAYDQGADLGHCD